MKRIVVVADLHIGHRRALTPKEYFSNALTNDFQRWVLDLEIEVNLILIAKDVLVKHEAETFEEALKIAEKEIRVEMYKLGYTDQDLDRKEQERKCELKLEGKRKRNEIWKMKL